MTSTKSRAFLFIELLSFLSCPLEIGRHFVVDVIGQGESVREIDLDAVTFADGYRGHDVEKLVEDLRRGLSCADSEALAHEVPTGCVECASGAGFADSSKRSHRQGDSEDAKVVVVDLVSETGVADLVEPLELIEADGIPVGHEHAMEHDGQTCLPKGVNLLGFAQQLRACRYQHVLAAVGINIG